MGRVRIHGGAKLLIVLIHVPWHHGESVVLYQSHNERVLEQRMRPKEATKLALWLFDVSLKIRVKDGHCHHACEPYPWYPISFGGVRLLYYLTVLSFPKTCPRSKETSWLTKWSDKREKISKYIGRSGRKRGEE